MVAMQYNQNWVIAATVLLLTLTQRSISTALLLIVAAGAVYFVSTSGLASTMWPVLIFGLITLSLILGMGGKPKQPEMYGGPEGYGDLFGGGGMGGMGGG